MKKFVRFARKDERGRKRGKDLHETAQQPPAPPTGLGRPDQRRDLHPQRLQVAHHDAALGPQPVLRLGVLVVVPGRVLVRALVLLLLPPPPLLPLQLDVAAKRDLARRLDRLDAGPGEYGRARTRARDPL